MLLGGTIAASQLASFSSFRNASKKSNAANQENNTNNANDASTSSSFKQKGKIDRTLPGIIYYSNLLKGWFKNLLKLLTVTKLFKRDYFQDRRFGVRTFHPMQGQMYES